MICEKINICDINNNLKDSSAYINVYIPDNSEEININKKRTTIVICPGGGYVGTSDREAEPVAFRFLSEGFNVIILRYSVAPNRFPSAILELSATMNYVHEMSETWNVDNNKIIVCGFSAGGHLVGSLGVLWNKDFISEALKIKKSNIKPNGMILGYPVITSGEFAHKGSFENLLGEESSKEEREKLSLEKLVSKDTPQTFLWHTFDDGAVPVENSLLFANSLNENKIPFELHIYPSGVHGLSLCDETSANKNDLNHINTHVESWFKLAIKWIDSI
ncbi:alpha/beta hydrolase [Clostridium sp. AL.422]|uniref:alpha/beta hydrolase n=1 Tax=Clostridium TaxID=1485 RepID=UPI00293DF902|nr:MULTISPECIES: alpha/beta hydrolase [unclassified Clostridium]MDV4152079.1 alpha/beta hydrolase [Clostridium sp. AL.422]